MKVTIHQPEHIPWLGFFHKIAQVDTCVILDDVQYEKGYFQNKNKIRTKDGYNWLIVALNKMAFDTKIKDVTIVQDNLWAKKWINILQQTYIKSKYGNLYLNAIADIIKGKYDKLADLNFALIKYLCTCLDVTTNFLISSEMETEGKASDKNLNICRAVGAETYLSGISGKDYLKLDDFEKAGIKVEFQEFHHPVYKQMYDPFMPCMSVIDLLCNHGSQSLDIIFGHNFCLMDNIF
jgi:hypothetical protein